MTELGKVAPPFYQPLIIRAAGFTGCHGVQVGLLRGLSGSSRGSGWVIMTSGLFTPSPGTCTLHVARLHLYVERGEGVALVVRESDVHGAEAVDLLRQLLVLHHVPLHVRARATQVPLPRHLQLQHLEHVGVARLALRSGQL
eukprot:806320-Pyramimonas_sp.AAC.1